MRLTFLYGLWSLAFVFLLPLAIIHFKKVKLKDTPYLLISGFLGNGIPAFLFAFAFIFVGFLVILYLLVGVGYSFNLFTNFRLAPYANFKYSKVEDSDDSKIAIGVKFIF